MATKHFLASMALGAILPCTLFALPSPFFVKTLSDGGLVTVEKEVSRHSSAICAATTNSLPLEWRAVDCEVQIEVYRFFFARKGEERKMFFEKEERCPTVLLGTGMHVPFAICDVVKRGTDLVILTASHVTELVIAGTDHKGNYEVKLRKELFRENALATLRQGRLVLSDTLYVLLELIPRKILLWRVDGYECVTIDNAGEQIKGPLRQLDSK